MLHTSAGIQFSSAPLLSFVTQTAEDMSSQWMGGQTGNLTAVYHSYTGKTALNCSNVTGKK